MTISKKLTVEVFKRDGFRCVYCGRTPPEIVLEVIHVEPVSKRGKGDIKHLDQNSIKEVMAKALTGERQDNYWNYFMELLESH